MRVLVALALVAGAASLTCRAVTPGGVARALPRAVARSGVTGAGAVVAGEGETPVAARRSLRRSVRAVARAALIAGALVPAAAHASVGQKVATALRRVAPRRALSFRISRPGSLHTSTIAKQWQALVRWRFAALAVFIYRGDPQVLGCSGRGDHRGHRGHAGG